MDLTKVVETLRDIILSELREEFRSFKAEINGQLKGYALALESLNGRMGNLENELRNLRQELREV
ncbi:MAG: hypothetical protein C0197_06490, partial [Caldimicrobium thiodismutans]